MPKSQSADTLLKRLQKIERAQARLGDITTRIRAQADTLNELLALAQGFVTEPSAPKPATRTRSTAPARKAAAARPATKRVSTRAATPSTAAGATAATRRAPRKRVSR